MYLQKSKRMIELANWIEFVIDGCKWRSQDRIDEWEWLRVELLETVQRNEEQAHEARECAREDYWDGMREERILSMR